MNLDFIWCTALWVFACYIMITEVSNNQVDQLYSYSLIGWCGLVVCVFIGLAVYSWLTSDAIKFTMVIARGEDIGPCDGSYYNDDGDLNEDTVGFNKGNQANHIPFTVRESNTVSSEMERDPEVCMV